ncbi:thioredoxin interacting protein a [Latimeria chalumnae]|uniref:thioredoxin interacting protein a n=1 Tax=Latimeria chalumnae TaxID=7897 RepID=UPI0006D90EBC|nr:PREDICTED: thioredoxin-interacting protein [Latimeria chalumnae]|eukprot:XP_014341398.1 PREDICTED: thioredoxin-interacting protein [Latimeria chalumnae]
MVMFKKMKSFEVVFSDPAKTYRSGEKVAGKVLLEVAEVTRVAAVKVLAVGEARVEWTEGSKRPKEVVEYVRYEDVLLLDNQPTDSDGSVILRPGNKYQYMFGFELPDGPMPTSYKGKHGCVEYWVKVFLEFPSQPALEIKKTFEVVEAIDVNTPELVSPVIGTKQQKVSCMFISDGKVSIAAKIERKGFCEGDEICIDADFQNACSRIVVPKAAILAKHTYLANGKTKVFREKLSSVRGDHIISGMSEAWRGKSLRIPKIKPSILGCNIIRVEYSLLIYVHVPGSKKTILDLPLVIGTIPYNGPCSRSSSLSSQISTEMSWGQFSLPDQFEAPPCYGDVAREDHRLDRPTTPLLDDGDSFDSPLFMYAPQFQFVPPPTYTEVDPVSEAKAE